MSEYDQTFDPNILIGHCDLISRFSDFALYLGTQMVYEQTSFKVCSQCRMGILCDFFDDL